jgi:hypothetical protein
MKEEGRGRTLNVDFLRIRLVASTLNHLDDGRGGCKSTEKGGNGEEAHVGGFFFKD